MMNKILRIDASARHTGSVTRDLNDLIVDRFSTQGDVAVTHRDLADPLPLLTEDWIAANFTDPAERTGAQRQTLALSDELVAELKAADIVLIGLPIYNFGVPGALKAWIDLVARARETFRYTEAGPEGLLTGKRAIVSVASGGTEMGSDIDFATGYVKHVLGFIGIKDVVFVNADRLMIDADASLKGARDKIAELPFAA
ncbi:MAG: NAD(P)H-dependent oxidoreductase [Paracoccaceae bacterium]|nr:NAD(P)H-dependent oxidoreductase [Paracoccaceae bacterium]